MNTIRRNPPKPAPSRISGTLKVRARDTAEQTAPAAREDGEEHPAGRVRVGAQQRAHHAVEDEDDDGEPIRTIGKVSLDRARIEKLIPLLEARDERMGLTDDEFAKLPESVKAKYRGDELEA